MLSTAKTLKGYKLDSLDGEVGQVALHGSHLRTYNTIFQHPISHNLEWRSVRALLKTLGQTTEESNGHLKVTRNGHTLVLQRPRHKDIAEDKDVMALRHFLEQSETIPTGTEADSADWLLVIDHHEARIFRSEIHGTKPGRFLANEAKEYFRQARAQDFSRGKEKPDPNRFFEPVAQTLQAAGQILVFGNGTGASSEMDQFVGWLKTHHPDTARRIIGWLAINEQNLTDDQILAKARDFYASAANQKKQGAEKVAATLETNLT